MVLILLQLLLVLLPLLLPGLEIETCIQLLNAQLQMFPVRQHAWTWCEGCGNC
jgi:hypothetical protein